MSHIAVAPVCANVRVVGQNEVVCAVVNDSWSESPATSCRSSPAELFRKPFPFFALPEDMQFAILSHLDLATVCKFSSVSKSSQYLAEDDHLWRQMWSKHMSHDADFIDEIMRSQGTTSVRDAFRQCWLTRTVCLGSWALVRCYERVFIINKHMNKHGGVALMFTSRSHNGAETSAASRHVVGVKAYHGSWLLSLDNGSATPFDFTLPTEIDWHAPGPNEPEFSACGMKFSCVGRHTMHITSLAAAGNDADGEPAHRIERITLNGLSVGWLDVLVGGKVRTLYPSDSLAKGV